MDNRLPLAMESDRSFYSAHFLDLDIWEPIVQQLCRLHGLGCKWISPGFPGTFPTFLVELDSDLNQTLAQAVVVKFFGPLFEGARSFHIERDMGDWLSRQSLPIHSPAVLADGQIDPAWSYLIFERVPGLSIRQVRQTLSAHDWDGIAELVGVFIKALHTASASSMPGSVNPAGASGWSDFVDFLAHQLANCQANHLQWGDLPSQLIPQVQHFLLPVEDLLDLSSPPHLIHADLTGDHLLGRLGLDRQVQPTATISVQPAGTELDTLAIIDWGDARIGNILYELVALHLDLFQTEKRLLSLCLESYGLPDFYRQSFARKALCMVLLHQFPMPAWVHARYSDVQSMEELAEHMYGV
jgi:hypothetical protein